MDKCDVFITNTGDETGSKRKQEGGSISKESERVRKEKRELVLRDIHYTYKVISTN